MIMAEVLPGDGDHKNWTRKQVRQDELAKMSRISRPSFTRRLSRCANQHGAADPRLNPVYEFVGRRRLFGRPNAYQLGKHLPACASRPKRRDLNLYSYPHPADLASHPQSGPLFDPDGPGGFQRIPRWMWHAKLPVSNNARLVMTYYAMHGLLERGECHPRQSTVARALGISVRSVHRANREWAAIGIIRVAHPKPDVKPDGSLRRGPQIIVYLPLRTLSREEAALEAERLQRARHRLLADQQRWWAGVEAIHARLLHEWAGGEHSLAAFHNRLRRELEQAGIPGGVIQVLVPRSVVPPNSP